MTNLLLQHRFASSDATRSRKSVCLARLALLCLCVFAGCSSGAGSHPEETDSATTGGALRIDIFSARGFLGGSEYERYYLTDKLLWRECGSVLASAKDNPDRKPLEGDEVLTNDPQLKIQQRRVERLTSSQIQSLRNAAADVLGTVHPELKRSEPPPGSVFSLSSPGVFEMLVEVGGKRERIISSVDAVADKQSDTLEKAHALFSILRGVGPEICSAPTFYGIERRAL